MVKWHEMPLLVLENVPRYLHIRRTLQHRDILLWKAQTKSNKISNKLNVNQLLWMVIQSKGLNIWRGTHREHFATQSELWYSLNDG